MDSFSKYNIAASQDIIPKRTSIRKLTKNNFECEGA
jgi:hypothetical protein